MESSLTFRTYAISIVLASSVALFSSVYALAADDHVDGATLSAIYGAGLPSTGNPSGVPIVEFFDYQCHYCKADEAELNRLAAEDLNVHVIYADFAKLGPASITAANTALASMRQGQDKTLWYRHILMSPGVQITDDNLAKAETASSLDAGRLRQDSIDPAITQYVQYEYSLGQKAGVRVTPSFIIGGRFVPGFQTYNQFKQQVAYARAGHSFNP
jgi:protein-disulfide isomerase